jgi:hypothetical protein
MLSEVRIFICDITQNTVYKDSSTEICGSSAHVNSFCAPPGNVVAAEGKYPSSYLHRCAAMKIVMSELVVDHVVAFISRKHDACVN